MLREPAFPESDFEQIRQQRIAGIENGRSEPQTLAALELARRLSPFDRGDLRYVGTIDEQIDEIRKVTLDHVRKFHAGFYGASGGELVVIGPVDPAAFARTAEELLGGWKSDAPHRRLSTPYKKTEPANLKIETPDKQNSLFQAGMRIRLSDDDPDYPAMLLANAMFGSGLGARMPNRIRNVEGLSYSVASRLAVPEEGEGAQFVGMAISAPQNTPKVEASFVDELGKTLKGGFTEEEVARVKKAWLDQQAVGRSQDQGLLRTLASREYAGKTMQWDAELEAKVRALTAPQVNAAFRRHLDPAALVIVKAGDFKAAGVF
jgi:zinc protease